MELGAKEIVDELPRRLVLAPRVHGLVLENKICAWPSACVPSYKVTLHTIVPSPFDGERAWCCRIYARGLPKGCCEVEKGVGGRYLVLLRRCGLSILFALLLLLLFSTLALDLLEFA